MKLYVALPTDRVDLGADVLSAQGVGEIARAAEDAGFDGIFTTEHPFPEDEWLASGGHHALDPFVALSFAAAATTRLRVFTNLCVLPYRNPFLAAKAALSLDVLSGGRLDFGVGAGYMEAEFSALGVDFDERNELFDEALEAVVAAWSHDGVAMVGRHFDAPGNTMLPRPVQQPHPPIWVGGNARRALRRAARHGDGWLPMPNPRSLGGRRHSAHLEDVDDLRRMLGVVHEERSSVGRDGPFDVLTYPFVPSVPGASGFSLDALVEHTAELVAAGATGLVVGLAVPSRAGYVEALGSYGAEVAPALRAAAG